METKPIVMERTYNAPAERVWDAITNPEKMRQWYFDIKSFKAEPGFEFDFTCGHEGRDFVHLCKVTEVVMGSKLAHTWRYDGFEGNSLVTWELFPEGEKTRLVLTHTGTETFPAMEFFARSNFNAGWTEILGTSLKEYVEK